MAFILYSGSQILLGSLDTVGKPVFATSAVVIWGGMFTLKNVSMSTLTKISFFVAGCLKSIQQLKDLYLPNLPKLVSMP